MSEFQSNYQPYRTIEVVDMFNDPDFIQALNELQLLINAYSDEQTMDANTINAEDAAIDAFNARFFNSEHWLERPATVVVATVDDQIDGINGLGINSFQARLAYVVPEDYKDSVIYDQTTGAHIQQPAHRSLALWFIDEHGYPITVPLSKSALLSCKVDTLMPQSPESDLTARLMNANDIFHNLLQSNMFLNSTIEEQRSYIQDFIEHLKAEIPHPTSATAAYEVLTINAEGSGVNVHSANKLAISFPDYVEREAPYRNLQDFPYGTSLWLYITNTHNQEVDATPLTNVFSITNTIQEQASQDISPTINLLDTFFADDSFIDWFNQIKNHINEITDPKEQARAIEEAVEELNYEFGDRIAGKLYRYKGRVYCDTGQNGAFVPYSVQADEGYAEGFDIQYINKSWQITLPLQVDPRDAPNIPTLPDEPAIICHVLPYSPHTQLLEQYDDGPDEQALQAAVICQGSAVQTGRLIKSKKFRQAALGRQVQLLKQAEALLLQSLDDLELINDSMMFDCQCSEYYAVDSELTDITLNDIAELGHVGVALEGEQSVRTISGVLAEITIPEIHDLITDERLKINDFVLSKGEPMLIIVDGTNSLTYFIPAGSVQALAPRYINAPYQD